jgi:GDPmannose 4,6-dehydratase
MKNKKVALITGCNAMDSKTLARFLQDKDYEVVLTYRRNSLFREDNWFEEVQIKEENKKRFHFEICDIVDQNSVRECLFNVNNKFGKIDEIYLIAAMSHVGNSFKMKEYSIMANGQSYYYFLEALRQISPKTKLYGALTSELAGNVPEDHFFNEETIWNPKSPYSIGKALGGHWIKFYRESLDSGLFCCFGVLFNHSNFFRTKDFFIMKACHAAASIACGEMDYVKFGNLNFYRDEHWSDYGVEMMWKMLQRETPKDYVIGTGETHHGEEYLDLAFNYFNLKWDKFIQIDKDLFRPNEVPRLVADSSLAQKELGWNPKRMSFKRHIELLCEFNLAKVKNREYKYPNLYI